MGQAASERDLHDAPPRSPRLHSHRIAGAGRKPAGVEFSGHSVSSGGFETTFSADPVIIAAALVAKNPELKWCETSRRGYMALTLTPERASNDWVFMDTVAAANPNGRTGHSMAVARGRNRLA